MKFLLLKDSWLRTPLLASPSSLLFFRISFVFHVKIWPIDLKFVFLTLCAFLLALALGSSDCVLLYFDYLMLLLILPVGFSVR